MNKDNISRREALNKIGSFSKYAAITAIGTYMILSPKKAQASSPCSSPPCGNGWGNGGPNGNGPSNGNQSNGFADEWDSDFGY